MLAVIFAVCSLCCSALNDFIFKLFADKPQSRGIFAILVGVVWTVVMAFLPMDWSHWQATVIWGIISGFFSIAANLMLIEAMGMQSAGICSTIYRLNLVPVVFGAWLLLDETISAKNWIGILFAVIAILCFMAPGKEDGQAKRKLGIYLVIGAALLRAGMGLSYKYGFEQLADKNALTMINGIMWIVGGGFYALIRERDKLAINKRICTISILSGLFVTGIVFFMAASVKLGDASIVLPIAQMSFPITMILSMIFLKEKATVAKWVGIGAAAAAILFLSV